MSKMRIWERNTTFVGGMLWVCYKTFCDLLEFLGTISKFFTNSIFDLVLLVFLCFVLFWEERDIKLEQRYIFAPIFNKDGLQETNRINLK